ncbi:hypothetical protein BDW42DRAFT_195209 [Aspergillus taichungensis]|uniref:Uncharacterized protein n=1 Tax=Aspergillus taichungensis TaxID=482145 RepID=A0A2J5HQ22_9EURO|nr:hypothetical protein BDW42DRAFT_195209 [Aspergillus taichungensis]
MLAPKFLLLLFTLFLGVVFARDATGLSPYDKRDIQARQDPRTRRPDEPRQQTPRPAVPLWVEHDTTLGGRIRPGNPRGAFYWSGTAHFNETPTDIQLVAMARDAHELMRWRWGQDNVVPKREPTVMSALCVGGDVFFASSVKGTVPAVYLDRSKETGWGEMQRNVPDEVFNALFDCFRDVSEHNGDEPNQHKNGASCGEIMAAWTFFKFHEGRSLAGARAVAWKFSGGRGQVFPPCGGAKDGGDNVWGCDQFLRKLGITAVNPRGGLNGVAYDRPRVVGHMPVGGVFQERPLPNGV